MVYTVHCTVYTIQCIVYTVYCIVYIFDFYRPRRRQELCITRIYYTYALFMELILPKLDLLCLNYNNYILTFHN